MPSKKEFLTNFMLLYIFILILKIFAFAFKGFYKKRKKCL